jgi:hypothetical protein
LRCSARRPVTEATGLMVAFIILEVDHKVKKVSARRGKYEFPEWSGGGNPDHETEQTRGVTPMIGSLTKVALHIVAVSACPRHPSSPPPSLSRDAPWAPPRPTENSFSCHQSGRVHPKPFSSKLPPSPSWRTHHFCCCTHAA